MGKIDTSEWKEFRIGDYFKVEYGRFHAKDELGTGTVNYITTSGFNNGITNTCELSRRSFYHIEYCFDFNSLATYPT